MMDLVKLETLLTLLGDALFALENVGVEEELCQRIRAVLKRESGEEAVTRVDDDLWDEMGY